MASGGLLIFSKELELQRGEAGKLEEGNQGAGEGGTRHALGAPGEQQGRLAIWNRAQGAPFTSMTMSMVPPRVCGGSGTGRRWEGIRWMDVEPFTCFLTSVVTQDLLQSFCTFHFRGVKRDLATGGEGATGRIQPYSSEMPAWRGADGWERCQPRLPWDMGTVNPTNISKSTCLKLAPYLSSPSTLTCFSSRVLHPGGRHHYLPIVHQALQDLVWPQPLLCPTLHRVPHPH